MPTKATKRGEKEFSSKTQRRERALSRLESQLKSGTKTEKTNFLTDVTTGPDKLPLSDSDKQRITKEINVLKSRV